jgi:hypothetical protein
MSKSIIIVFGITILFLGVTVQPAIATVEPKERLLDIEPKDYLFQTLIDIANNPEVKELLDQYENDLFNVDIDRNVYRKLLMRNPRLMFNTLFTKLSMSVEYLNKCYSGGINLIKVIGEDHTLEIIESVEFKNPETFEKIDDIINDNSELKVKAEILVELNKNLKSDSPYQYNPVICIILEILFAPVILARIFLLSVFSLFNDLFPLLREFFLLSLEIRLSLFMYFMTKFECIDWPPYS